MTFGTVDLSDGTIGAFGSMPVFAGQGIVSSTWDSANNVFILSDGTNMYRGGYPSRIYSPDQDMFITSLVFNWRNNGYYGVVMATESTNAYVAKFSLSNPLKVTKVVELTEIDYGYGCSADATYDIASGNMYLVCTDPNKTLYAVSLSSATYTRTQLSDQTIDLRFLVSVS